jgi:ribonuclease E|tara:strand:+ start:178 stop:453 length:276 start_codon:yes stop_codon:yes gene_type:complete
MENIEQLIQQAADKDYATANATFVDIMNQKLADTLEQERIKVSGQIYNGMESEEDEEQLELDLEDDESEEDDVDVDDDDDTDDSDEDTEES